MNSLEFETEELRPVKAWCDKVNLFVSLKDGRTISAPLWWFPFLDGYSDTDLNDIELQFEGIWWNQVDEGVSVKGLLLGWKSPGARDPDFEAA